MAFTLKPSTHLLDHQKDGVDFILDKRACLLLDTPGTGKTLQILKAICEVKQKALVVMPPFLANNWTTEIHKFTNLEIGKDIDIVPYTMLTKRIKSFDGYGFVAADEAHYLKNLDAQRTQTFHSYMNNRPEYLVLATGTPLKNRIPEVYSLLLLLSYFDHVSPKVDTLYNSYYKFCMRFCNVSEKRFSGRSVMQFSGMKNVEELKEYIKPWSIRRKAEDYINLPEMNNQTIVANYKGDTDLAAAFAAFTSGESGKDIVAKKNSAIAKAHFTAEWVSQELESGAGPVVVFSDHRDPVSMIERELSTKWKVASILGGDAMNARSSIVDQFQKGQLDVLVATIGSASVGITLTRSNLVVFNDVPWIVADLEQARKRIHRISQDKPCRCVYVAGSEVDDMIIRNLKAKLKVINAVVEN